MLVFLRSGATAAERDRVLSALRERGFRTEHREEGGVAVIEAPAAAEVLLGTLAALSGVERVDPTGTAYRLAAGSSGNGRPATRVRAGAVTLGDGSFTVIAGPCAVEGREVVLRIADAAREAGARMLRGGAFKPRTSPYSFRGLGEEGLKILREAGDRTGLPVVTEVMDTRQVDLVARYADVLQVGSRNMHNFALLAEVGRQPRPVLLKRGMSATLGELLGAAEYVLAAGNGQVVLCERGIRTFGEDTRNTLDLAAVPALRALTHLPVIVDPSHASGRADLVRPLARAAAAAGADGVMVEVHVDPAQAFCDARQAILPAELAALVAECAAVREAIRGVAAPSPARSA